MDYESSFIQPMSEVEHDDARLTQFTEISSAGFNRLLRAQRYGRWWVLKGLKAEYREQPFYQQLLRKEFEVMISLQHHGVVTAVGMERVEGIGTCIVMEWLDAQRLDQWLAHNRPERQQRRKVFLQILDAVEYIHSRQVTHRDLKPQNILVTRNGQMPKLIDFGVSDADNYAALKQPAGTLSYISPEQSLGHQTDLRNDIYSLGCILRDMQLGLGSKWVVRRCLRPIDRRYANVAQLRRAVQRVSRIPYYICTLLGVLCLSLAVFFVPGKGEVSADEDEAFIPDIPQLGITDTIFVGSADELDRARQYDGRPNVCICLTRDIDLTDWIRTHCDSTGWIPLGADAHFRGSFDGRGHTISGLFIHRIDTTTGADNGVGLFGRLRNATIRNLTVKGDVTGAMRVGGLGGYMVGGTIENCHFEGTTKGQGEVGGLLGMAREMLVVRCSAKGSVTGSKLVGGLLGCMDGTGVLAHCRVAGDVVADSVAVGGVVGLFCSPEDRECHIDTCSFVGTVRGDVAGGLLGRPSGRRVIFSIHGCTVKGDITGQTDVGGLLGHTRVDGVKGEICDCTVSGNILAENSHAGGLVGELGFFNWFNKDTYLNVSRCSFNGSVQATKYVGGIVGKTYGMEDRIGKQWVKYSHCKAQGRVQGVEIVGGFAGYVSDMVILEHNTVRCTVSAAEGGVVDDFVAVNDGSTIIP